MLPRGSPLLNWRLHRRLNQRLRNRLLQIHRHFRRGWKD